MYSIVFKRNGRLAAISNLSKLAVIQWFNNSLGDRCTYPEILQVYVGKPNTPANQVSNRLFLS